MASLILGGRRFSRSGHPSGEDSAPLRLVLLYVDPVDRSRGRIFVP